MDFRCWDEARSAVAKRCGKVDGAYTENLSRSSAGKYWLFNTSRVEHLAYIDKARRPPTGLIVCLPLDMSRALRASFTHPLLMVENRTFSIRVMSRSPGAG
jgi:hypothetical protein